MSDITKCNGKDCPIKDVCYRFTATTGIFQSWFIEIPGKYVKEDNSLEPQWKCNNFWGKHEETTANLLKK